MKMVKMVPVLFLPTPPRTGEPVLFSKGPRAVTLVELVITLTVLAIAIPTLMNVAAYVAQRSVRSAAMLKATRLAQDLTEEILSVNFDELAGKDANGNWSTTLAAETSTKGRDGAANESASNKTTFDDADDFNGFSETMAGSFAGYTRSVTVAYVSAPNINTPLAIPSPVPNSWAPDYKRVVVTVTPPVGPSVSVVTLVTPVNFL